MYSTIENIKAGIMKRAARGLAPVSVDPRQRGMQTPQAPQAPKAPTAPAARQYTQNELNTYNQRREADSADLHNRTQAALGAYQPVGPGADYRRAAMERVRERNRVAANPVTLPPRAYAPAPAKPSRPLPVVDPELVRQSIASIRNIHPASTAYGKPLTPEQQNETLQLEAELQRARQNVATTEADKQLTGYLDQDEFTRFRERSLMASRRMQELRQNTKQDQMGALYNQLAGV